MGVLHFLTFFSANLRNTSESKLKIIKVLLSILSPKLDEVHASYACKNNSILQVFYVFHCISSVYHIIMQLKKNKLKINFFKNTLLLNISIKFFQNSKKN